MGRATQKFKISKEYNVLIVDDGGGRRLAQADAFQMRDATSRPQLDWWFAHNIRSHQNRSRRQRTVLLFSLHDNVQTISVCVFLFYSCFYPLLVFPSFHPLPKGECGVERIACVPRPFFGTFRISLLQNNILAAVQSVLRSMWNGGTFHGTYALNRSSIWNGVA